MPQPQKATFQIFDEKGNPGKPIPVEFNPTEYTLNKGAQVAEIAIPGLDSPILQFVRGQTESLSLDLFFDSTESGMDDSARSVTEKTDPFYQLVKMQGKQHAPPICYFAWGATFPGSQPSGSTGSPQRLGFKCVVESVRQRFTLFSPQGVPLRATLTVSLKEYKTLKEQIDEINKMSADHTQSHVVQTSETLAQIANQVYGDPSQWRAIADANQLFDPLNLATGAVLTIPVLTT